MNDPRITLAAAPAGAKPVPAVPPALPREFAWMLALPVLAHAQPLWHLAHFAAADSRYSHILLIPLLSAYLAWIDRDALRRLAAPRRAPWATLMVAAAVVLSAWVLAHFAAASGWAGDALAATTLGFVVAVVAMSRWTLGGKGFRAVRFPVAFLLFMVPLPQAAMSAMETFSQHGSAIAAHLLFAGAGSTVHFQNLTFQLPGINLHVAPECSGIRSTLVLFMVSVLAGHLFLRSNVSRVLLAAAVIPLALVRNGFRIFTIGELCTRIGPEMIDSFLHRQGGPIFFALSLVPLLGCLVLLARWERRARGGAH